MGSDARDRQWPPLLEWAITSVFAADPRTAYDRLAPYLDGLSLTEAFLTHRLITTIGDAIAAVLEPDRARFYEADGRWPALVARLASTDPLWKRYAKRSHER